MSKHSLSAWHHQEWDALGLQDYSDFSDCVTDCNQQEWADHTTGQWFYIPDDRLPNGDWVIYSGTWGNDNSPGASSYTYADIYDDEAEFLKAKQEWESQEEWLESEMEDEEDDTPKEFEFTFTVVGTGKTEEDAWKDAKQSAEQKVASDEYDEANEMDDDE